MTLLCRCLDVTRSGFYAWPRQSESTRARRGPQLGVRIRAWHEASRGRHGRPRVWRDLHEARLQRAEELRAGARTPFRSTTICDHDHPVAGNVLHRQFVAVGPNQRWVDDATELRVGSAGKVYLTAIPDLSSRVIVGGALSAVNDRPLVWRALDMAIKLRSPDPGLLHDSEQGCTYASEDKRAGLDRHRIVCGMSRRGNGYDNAVIKSWFSTVKSEEGERLEGDAHPGGTLFDHIEVFHHQRRRNSRLGQTSPAEYERRSARAAWLNLSNESDKAH